MRLLSSKSYDPGKCLEIRHRGSMQPLFLPLQLAAAGISAAHQHITTQCSTDQSAFLVHSTLPGLFGKGSRAQPLAKQPSWGFTQHVMLSWLWFVYGLIYKESQILSQVRFISGQTALTPFISVLIYTHQTKYLQIISLLNFPKRISSGTFKPRQPTRLVKWVWNCNSSQHKVPTLQSLERMILYLVNLFKMLPRNCLILHGWCNTFPT